MPYKNKDTQKKYWHTRNRNDKGLEAQLKVRYGLSLDEYRKLEKAQNGVCAICHKMDSDTRRKRLSVDHNHSTRQIRSLLCSSCNLLVGFVEDYIKSWEPK